MSAATNDRKFRTFLLMTQFEAKAIGARIARARDEAGLTQEELAEMASFSKRSLQDYEAGTTIPYRHMREISSLLNREVPWFLHGEQQQVEGVGDLLEAIRSRLEALEAKTETYGEASAKSLDALAREVRSLARRIARRDGGATATQS